MSGFKMYVTTKLGNPSYTPEVRTDNTLEQLSSVDVELEI